jgi:hypothetical protein
MLRVNHRLARAIKVDLAANRPRAHSNAWRDFTEIETIYHSDRDLLSGLLVPSLAVNVKSNEQGACFQRAAALQAWTV